MLQWVAEAKAIYEVWNFLKEIAKVWSCSAREKFEICWRRLLKLKIEIWICGCSWVRLDVLRSLKLLKLKEARLEVSEVAESVKCELAKLFEVEEVQIYKKFNCWSKVYDFAKCWTCWSLLRNFLSVDSSKFVEGEVEVCKWDMMLQLLKVFKINW